MLIPDPKSLYKIECKADQYYDLRNWFACVEDLAWETVNTFLAEDRPEKIFLLTGETLSPSYATAHTESTSQKIEMIVGAGATVPGPVKNGVQFLDQFHMAPACGFEDIRPPSESGADRELFSIFLDVWPSFPLQRFKKTEPLLLARLPDMFRWAVSWRRLKKKKGVLCGTVGSKRSTNKRFDSVSSKCKVRGNWENGIQSQKI